MEGSFKKKFKKVETRTRGSLEKQEPANTGTYIPPRPLYVIISFKKKTFFLTHKS
jgi:hypothetical protein